MKMPEHIHADVVCELMTMNLCNLLPAVSDLIDRTVDRMLAEVGVGEVTVLLLDARRHGSAQDAAERILRRFAVVRRETG